ncbi:FtsX-like permease family protein [Gleimia hominis]|uniref:FtsX-like permease family protein n=1 Tax=Gleimia hominis TaxID=595468 RepID=UPI000C80A67F|nr:ABC transporter permease [Gleimia hominis]WIK63909.1 ABC transporter permease [Gleimia hominis]
MTNTSNECAQAYAGGQPVGMSGLSRAGLAISRRGVKNLILGFILAVTAVLLTVVLCWRFAAAVTSNAITSGVDAGFTVSAPADGTEIPRAALDQFSSVKKVGTPTLVSRTTAQIDGQIVQPQGVQLEGNLPARVSVLGVDSSARLPGFKTKVWRIVEGAGFAKNADAAAPMLVHRELAAKNGWRVGSVVQLAFSGVDSGGSSGPASGNTHGQAGRNTPGTAASTTQHSAASTTQAFKVVGIFEAPNEDAVTSPDQMVENTVVTPATGVGSVAEAVFPVKDAAGLHAAFDSAQNIALKHGLKVSSNVDAFKSVLEAAVTQVSWLNTLLAVLGVASLLAVTFVLVFWVRGRLHEVGVLLSIGLHRSQVFTQFLVEVLLLAIPAAVFGLVAGLGVMIFVEGVDVPHVFAAGGAACVALVVICVVALCLAFLLIARRSTKQILTSTH